MSAVSRDITSKPTSVVHALVAMWTMLALSVIYLAWILYIGISSGQATLPMLVPVTIPIVLIQLGLALVIFFTGRGKNWARIVYTVVASIAIVGTLLGVALSIGSQSFTWSSLVVPSAIVGVYAFILAKLYASGSREWFRPLREEA